MLAQSNVAVTKLPRRALFMNADCMSNELVDAPKIKIDSRQASKRRLSRNHPSLENGGSETLTSPLNEAMSVTVNLNSNTKQMGFTPKEVRNQGENNNSGLAIEAKCGSSEPKLSKEESQDARHWKELVLLHLDLIQQQRDIILAKDQQIKTLTQEKEALKQRLERMERRMSLVRQRACDASPVVTPHRTPRVPATPATVPGTPSGTSLLGSCRRGDTSQRGSKRKLSALQPQNLSRKFTASVGRGTSTPCRRRDRATRCTPASSVAATAAATVLPSSCEKPTTRPIVHATSTTTTTTTTAVTTTPIRTSVTMTDVNTMSTKTLYYTAMTCCRDDSDENDATDDRRLVGLKDENKDVPVPTWRHSHIPTGYQMEGTENLDDEIFSKRHQKPEADERRRKRWDLQRLREERTLQKTGHGPTDALARSAEDISFIPQLDQVTHIQVDDSVPVSAFGRPLPQLTRHEFELPWYDGRVLRQTTEKSKSARSKRR